MVVSFSSVNMERLKDGKVILVLNLTKKAINENTKIKVKKNIKKISA